MGIGPTQTSQSATTRMLHNSISKLGSNESLAAPDAAVNRARSRDSYPNHLTIIVRHMSAAGSVEETVAVAETGRNPVSKHQIQPECRD